MTQQSVYGYGNQSGLTFNLSHLLTILPEYACWTTSAKGRNLQPTELDQKCLVGYQAQQMKVTCAIIYSSNFYFLFSHFTSSFNSQGTKDCVWFLLQ